MNKIETELEMVQRHVSQSLIHLKRQKALIKKLTIRNQPLFLAEQTLQLLLEVQKEHEAHLTRLQIKTVVVDC